VPVCVEDPRGARHWGADLAPHTSHEGSWVKRALHCQPKTAPVAHWPPGRPSRPFLTHINCSPMEALWSCGRRTSVVQAQRQIHRAFCRPLYLVPRHEGGTVKGSCIPTCRSVLESVARAHLLTAALMPAEPHIRSPFRERLAPQSLILEVIGLGRAGPHCIAAYHSHCMRRSAPPGSNGADQASWNSR
jgi:hypothetical protein